MKKKIKIFFFVFIAGIFSYSYSTSAEMKEIIKDSKLHKLPIKSFNNIKPNEEIILKPYPSTSLELASKSVNIDRNPFSGLTKKDSDIIINFQKYFTLKGIVQYGNKVNAILSSPSGISLYEEGDFINKEFKIKRIHINEEIIIFTDGQKEFKLAFKNK
tara:strand:+ start:59 stop:535 length:477 start_codon:yes stop_codon:yes gene_type:complete